VGTVVLDTSVVIALFDPDDAHHKAAASQTRQLRDEGVHFSAPATVLAEVLIGSARRGEEAVRQRKARFVDAFGRPRVIDEDVAVAAAELRARHRSLRLPDALVIAVGLVDDVEVVLTADKRWAEVDERVRVIG
jgi:predicted nucleic acid-binding protein